MKISRLKFLMCGKAGNNPVSDSADPLEPSVPAIEWPHADAECPSYPDYDATLAARSIPDFSQRCKSGHGISQCVGLVMRNCTRRNLRIAECTIDDGACVCGCVCVCVRVCVGVEGARVGNAICGLQPARLRNACVALSRHYLLARVAWCAIGDCAFPDFAIAICNIEHIRGCVLPT